MLACSLESNDLTTLEWKYRKLSVTTDELVICIYRRPMNFLFLELCFKYLLWYYRKCTLKEAMSFVAALGYTKKNDMNRWIDKVWINQEYLHIVAVERYRNIPTTPISNNNSILCCYRSCIGRNIKYLETKSQLQSYKYVQLLTATRCKYPSSIHTSSP